MNTSEGDVNVQQVIVAVAPWVARMWGLLGLPRRLDIRSPDGSVARDQEMWTYWYLQEGEVDVDPSVFVTADGKLPPVLHVDSHAPLSADDGELVTDEQWGIYFKQDKDGVQGGASPLPKGHDFEVDPYPTGSAEPTFPDLWCAALSLHGALRGQPPEVQRGPFRRRGAFTADNFPVFDYMRPNVFVIADSNHGYKMIAVGREVANMVLGEHSSLLHPSATSASRPATCTRSHTALSLELTQRAIAPSSSQAYARPTTREVPR